MLTAEQVAERTKYIGASDAAAVLGLSRWKTPLQVWAEKTGAVAPEDLSDKLPIEVGNELEELVAKLYAKRTGKKVARVNETQFHPNYPFIAANLDRRIVGEKAILECKTASAWKAKEWEGEDVPQEYVIQALHQLGVTGADRCDVAVLIGGNQDFRIKSVYRDEAAIGEIFHKEADFWTRFVEPKVMPQTVTADDSGILGKLFPNGQEVEAVDLGQTAAEIAAGIAALESQKDAIEAAIEKEKNGLRLALGTNAVGVAGSYRVTWKNQETTRLDVGAVKENHPELWTKYATTKKGRVFRITEIKQNKGDK